jgi:integrase
LGLTDVINDKTDRQCAVDEANRWLKAEGYPVRLKLKGNNLALRATLPNKPGKGEGRSREEISLLIPATKTGLARAKREAVILADRMANGSFNWAMYIEEADPLADKSIEQWVEDFKDSWMGRGKTSEATWANDWNRFFKKLPQDQPLKDSLILTVVSATKENTRNREIACKAMGNLAKFAGLLIDLHPYIGNYEPEPRDIPPDALIIEWRDRIPNPAYQWAYGLMAAFGVRPHEIFECEFIDPLRLQIKQNTKTGARITRAIRPEWSEQWNLIEVIKPPTEAATMRDRGQLLSHAHDRYGIPFVPYDLRHAWAIRATVVEGVKVHVAARMMGHSVETHNRVYQRWMTEDTAEQEYVKTILRKPITPDS